ncbi:peptidylprolyl isomerase [Parasphingorhabdus sp. SCSIO 66989]|uniref:Parvulin-like PPIase n=2 Tax=Alterisphingorhabdus coralli TaxID=3071408 RepID=A0AA97I2P8_9SPHN|nr:peptidylprolyl isomerase [Parasphingorhabdus sp. SCSIO 66989]WOE76635.1 peptidylprolyl isomerase [Parasphingorhabdus sp. SCSIO 66989]
MTFALLTATALAQTVNDSEVPSTELNLPEKLTVFGSNDPNMRRATAIVNGEIITGTDIDQRLALIVAASGGKTPSDEQLKSLRLEVLRNLIDETLQIQEAAANDIVIQQADINRTYQSVAQGNFRIDPAEMDGFLRKNGSSPYSLKRQIMGELAWQRLLGRNVQPFINVSEEEVQSILKRLEADKGTEEYRLGEIYLSATPNNANEIFQNGRRIMQQLQQGGSFAAYARQWSEATTAASGGDLGWVKLQFLPNELAEAARTMSVGQLAGPIEIPGGFSIVYLIDKRQILSADPRDARLSLKQLAIQFPQGIDEGDATNRAAAFANAAKAIRGCGDAERAAQQVGATIVDNDNVRVRDLPGPLQQTLLNLSVGEATPPFGSVKDGVRVLVLCGRDDPKVATGPSADEMMRTIEDERVNKRAQIYLRDLRRDAVIEYN